MTPIWDSCEDDDEYEEDEEDRVVDLVVDLAEEDKVVAPGRPVIWEMGAESLWRVEMYSEMNDVGAASSSSSRSRRLRSNGERKKAATSRESSNVVPLAVAA